MELMSGSGFAKPISGGFILKVLFGLFISLNLWAQTSPRIDWEGLSDVMSAYQADGSLAHLKSNVRLFLLSSPVESLSSARQNSEDCDLPAEKRELIKPELIDILFSELVQNFPFYEPQIVGCQGFFW